MHDWLLAVHYFPYVAVRWGSTHQQSGDCESANGVVPGSENLAVAVVLCWEGQGRGMRCAPN
eukprot:186060-Prorocentrum_lima.AAC.1